MLNKTLIMLACFTMLSITACGQKEYFEAVKEQNVTIQNMNMANEARKEREEQRHEERMLTLMQTSMNAAASTKDKTDDVLVPLLIMSMEDKRIMAKALTANSEKHMQLQAIKAPDSFGDGVRKSTGALLGIGGIVMGITQSNNMADIAAAGMNAAGVHNTISGDSNAITSDSYKTASQNKMHDNNTINSGDMTVGDQDSCKSGECSEENVFDLKKCINNPPGGFKDGTPFWNNNGCSCKSHADKHC